MVRAELTQLGCHRGVLAEGAHAAGAELEPAHLPVDRHAGNLDIGHPPARRGVRSVAHVVAEAGLFAAHLTHRHLSILSVAVWPLRKCASYSIVVANQ